MPNYYLGARAHDYGRGTPLAMFQKLQKDGWTCTQLAYTKSIEGIHTVEDVTPAVVDATRAAMAETGFRVPVLGVYRELAIADEERRRQEVRAFISQMPVCRALGASCMGSETTGMEKQPAGTTLAEAQRQLYKSLGEILPAAEALGVTVALEPVWHHALCSAEFAREVLDTMRSPALRLIFDPANLLAPDLVDRQDELYGRAIELWGDKIMAVHFKGVRYVNGRRTPCPLEESAVEYETVFRHMKDLPQTELPVIREEAVPARAAEDRAFMQAYCDLMRSNDRIGV